MTKKFLKAQLKEDIAAGMGEILNETNEDITYYDYENGVEVTYRFASHCTLDWLKSRFIIGETAKQRGLTADFLAKCVFKAFGKDFADAICTLKYIAIFSNQEEFQAALDIIDDDKFSQSVFEYNRFENVLGQLWYMNQSVLISEQTHYDNAKELSQIYCLDKDEWEKDFQEEYSNAIITTLIHEIRHCMLDTNVFLSSDKYPKGIDGEDEVEDFCRSAFDKLPYAYQMIPNLNIA